MTSSAAAVLWAIGSDLPVRVLAVAGGAAVGAFVVGWLVHLVVSFGFRQKVPGFVLLAVRLLSGLGCGLLVYFWLFGTGGGGWGWGQGQGGRGEGDGAKTKSTDGTSPRASDKDSATARGSEKPQSKQSETKKAGRPGSGRIGVEVLGGEALAKLSEKKVLNLQRCYRLEGDAPATLYSLDEVKAAVERLRQQDAEAAKLPVRVILYLDSPDAAQERVAALEAWAKKQNGSSMSPIDRPAAHAPVE